MVGCAFTGRESNPLDRLEKFQSYMFPPFQDLSCRKLGSWEAQVLDLARINKAPIAVEAVERIDALFVIENGVTPQECACVRNESSRPLVIALESWLREQRARVSKNSSRKRANAFQRLKL
jgi:hypothetical protein